MIEMDNGLSATYNYFYYPPRNIPVHDMVNSYLLPKQTAPGQLCAEH